MNNNEDIIDRALRNSRASVEFEGLEVSEINDEICRSLINGEISKDESTRLILENSKASIEFERLFVSEQNDDICRRLLDGEITNDEANELILKLHGVNRSTYPVDL